MASWHTRTALLLLALLLSAHCIEAARSSTVARSFPLPQFRCPAGTEAAGSAGRTVFFAGGIAGSVDEHVQRSAEVLAVEPDLAAGALSYARLVFALIGNLRFAE
jgi:hypothetical protein